jgi:hypothetical protein
MDWLYIISSAVGGISVVLLILHQIDVMDKIDEERGIQLGNSWCNQQLLTEKFQWIYTLKTDRNL